jgi:polo-like kinase 1
MASSTAILRRSSLQDPGALDTIIEETKIGSNSEVSIIKYLKKQFLGKGGFARVYEFECLSNKKKYASKIIPKSSLIKERRKQKLMSEIKIHRSLNHTNIVDFEHFFEDNDNVYILLELCTNQTMTELIRRRKRLTELEVQSYMIQIISGLNYLHSKKVIHRDLKIGNLFITEKMGIKIGDFGLAAKLDFEGEKKRTVCGTPNYIAPEVLDGQAGHSYEVDVWSLGVILYTLLIGKPPFETSEVKKTYDLIKRNAYSFPDYPNISKEAKSLITQILKLDPKRRPTLSEILKHEFFYTNTSIPKLLPVSTLAVPPSEAYIKKYNRLPYYLPPQSSSETMPVQYQFSPRKTITFNTEKPGKINNSLEIDLISPVYVKKWIDYSSKYGLGYLLSNGDAGAYFNDSSKIILHPNSNTFHYIERTNNKNDTPLVYNILEYPESLHKKFTLLQRFKSYLESEPGTLSVETGTESALNYIKKWVRTKRAILFKFITKDVQVIFQDQTEVILSNQEKILTYANKEKHRTILPMNKALLSPDPEIGKRIKYTRDILNYMMTAKPMQSP